VFLEKTPMQSTDRSLRVRCLGVTSCTPERGANTASFAINGRIVLDTGWYLTDRLLAAGVNPLDIEAVVFTHCHHDHIMGFPQILFYYGISWENRPERPLRVFGPAGEIGRVVADGLRYLQFDRYPELNYAIEVTDLRGGQSFDLCGLRVSTCPARHNVPGLCYRFDDPAGASAVFSGDTSYNPDLVELARGATLLVHEASHGAASARGDERWGHSGAPDAAEVARQAGVARLALVHCGESARPAALEAALAIFPASFFPSEGEELTIAPTPP